MKGALLSAGVIALLGAAAAAYHVTTVNGKAQRWPSWTATLYTDPAMPPGVAAAMRRAEQTWTDVEGSAFLFLDGGDSPSAKLGDHGNGSNDVFFASQPPYIYAVTYTRSSGADIVETDVIFNTAFTWTTNGSPAGAADVETVALHEFGHVLGLGHEDAVASVMHTSGDASIPVRQLYADDRAGASFLYPSAGSPDPGTSRADVAAESLSILSGVPGPGAYLSVRSVFGNRSGFACDPFSARITLSTPRPISVADEAVALLEILSIPAASSSVKDVYALLPAALPPGTWRLGLLADPEDALGDPRPENNVAASAPFEVKRAPGKIVLGASVDAALGPRGEDAVDLWIGAGTRVSIRARGVRGVRPAIAIRALGSDTALAEDGGARSASLRWTAPADGTYRLSFANGGDAVGRVRIATSGFARVRATVEAPGLLPFPAYEGGSAMLSAVFDGAASPLACRPASGPDVTSPGSVRGHRARLGPVVPGDSGVQALVLGGAGTSEAQVLSRTVRRGETLVR